MKKKIISVFLIIILIVVMIFVAVKKKDKEELEISETFVAKVLSVSSDGLTVRDENNIIYTFKDFNDENIVVGENFVLSYRGTLDKNKCAQTAKILSVASTEEILPLDGIFSNYYKLAANDLENMTLREKIGQVLLVGAFETGLEEMIKDNKYSGLVLFDYNFEDKTKSQVQKMLDSLQKVSEIPLLLAVDEEGGSVIRVSSNPLLVSKPFKSSQELYKEGGLNAIREDTIDKSEILHNLGLNVNLAPVVDVTNNKTAYIYKRTLGQNTEITSEYAKTVIKASKEKGVSYVLKHFPGYGDNLDTHEYGSEDNRTYEEIEKNSLPPFIAGVSAGAEAIMVSHNIINNIDPDVPASLSTSVHNLLRNEIGFTGIIMTDDLSMAAINDKDALIKALEAGNDLLIVTNAEGSIDNIEMAVKDGVLSESVVDNAALRVLAWKHYKGLFIESGKWYICIIFSFEKLKNCLKCDIIYFGRIFRRDENMEVKFTIEKFEGPLDLLLHLIKVNDLDIADINVSEITEQYLDYIRKMEELDLNVGSEYLVMASELTYIKSKTLLPCEAEEEEEENPREELINKLIEYQRYKELSETFKELELSRQDLFGKDPSYLNEFKEDGIIIDENITLEDLIKAFANFNLRKEQDKPLSTTITKKEYSVSERSHEIMKKLKEKKKLNFTDLFEIVNKEYIVVTFLSILDLARKGRLNIKQDKNLSEIVILTRGDN